VASHPSPAWSPVSPSRVSSFHADEATQRRAGLCDAPPSCCTPSPTPLSAFCWSCPVTSLCVTSSRSSAALMEQAAKAIAAFHLAGHGWVTSVGLQCGREALVLPEPGLCRLPDQPRPPPPTPLQRDRSPQRAWVWRQMIEATLWGQHPSYLIHDRDRVYGADFAIRIAGLGIQSIGTQVRSPLAKFICGTVCGDSPARVPRSPAAPRPQAPAARPM
jgi:hypothetical protein